MAESVWETHVREDMQEHVENLRWVHHHDESVKQSAESLQKS